MVFVVFRLLVWSLQAVLVDVRAVPGDVKSHREEEALWLNYDCVCYPPWIAWMLLQRAVGRPAMVSTVQKIVQAELIFRIAKNRTRKITFPNMSNLEFSIMFDDLWSSPWLSKCVFFHITDCRLCPGSGHADTVRAPGVFCTAALRTKPWAEAAAWRLNQGDPYPTKILWWSSI